jgi:hypothetical protein
MLRNARNSFLIGSTKNARADQTESTHCAWLRRVCVGHGTAMQHARHEAASEGIRICRFVTHTRSQPRAHARAPAQSRQTDAHNACAETTRLCVCRCRVSSSVALRRSRGRRRRRATWQRQRRAMAAEGRFSEAPLILRQEKEQAAASASRQEESAVL